MIFLEIIFLVIFVFLIYMMFRNKQVYELRTRINNAQFHYNIHEIHKHSEKSCSAYNKLPSYGEMLSHFWRRLTPGEWVSKEDLKLLKDYL